MRKRFFSDIRLRTPAKNISRGIELNNTTMTFETGQIAPLADGSIVAKHGSTSILATAVSESLSMFEAYGKTRPGFLPLSVDVREKMYSVGTIPSTRTGREMGVNDSEILASRIVDRSIRPLFPGGYYLDSQIVATVLSLDPDCAYDTLCINAASAAISVSDIPWAGPVAAVRVAIVNGDFVANPNRDEIERSDLNLIYVGTGQDGSKCVMIEADGAEIPKDQFMEALRFARDATVPILNVQNEFAALHGKEKRVVPDLEPNRHVLDTALTFGVDKAMSVLRLPDLSKSERGVMMGRVRKEITEHLENDAQIEVEEKNRGVPDAVCKRAYRRLVLNENKRADGRGIDEVRPLLIDVGCLGESVHGSAYFGRGDTHTLCIATLGQYEARQNEFAKLNANVGLNDNFMVHYEFPPYSVNETGRIGGINRRMVGHGKLSEKAIAPLLARRQKQSSTPLIGPQSKDFPYFVKINSEVTASDGSSSMSTVCGASLAMFDAGVPLSKHVAGISVGIMSTLEPGEQPFDRYKILTDIRGLEDHYGDCDFKIAGTQDGLTAIQLDIKLKTGIPVDILCEALEQAEIARLGVLSKMNEVKPLPRQGVRSSAPTVQSIPIAQEDRKVVIGKGGSMIKCLEKLFDCKSSLDDHGNMVIFGSNSDTVEKTIEAVRGVVLYEIADGDVCSLQVKNINEKAGFNVSVKAASKDAQNLLSQDELEEIWKINAEHKSGFVPKRFYGHNFSEVKLGDVFEGISTKGFKGKDDMLFKVGDVDVSAMSRGGSRYGGGRQGGGARHGGGRQGSGGGGKKKVFKSRDSQGEKNKQQRQGGQQKTKKPQQQQQQQRKKPQQQQQPLSKKVEKKFKNNDDNVKSSLSSNTDSSSSSSSSSGMFDWIRNKIK